MGTVELWIIQGLIGMLVGVLWYLLRQKDAAQAEEIKMLWKKHHENEGKITDLRLRLAENHYRRDELDVRFEKLEATFKEGFQDMGAKFDKLSDALLAHMAQENRPAC